MRVGALRMSAVSRIAEPQLELLAARSSQPAARSLPLLDERQRGTRFLSLPVRSALNTPAVTHMGFWSINPYVGCEFGCTYCYARDTHRYIMERRGSDDAERMPAWQAFEKRILVKRDIVEVLARTLDPSRIGSESLVIGTATDCYQPAERRFRLTRGILELLLQYRGLSIGIITKSPLVTRDLAILQRLGERHEVTVDVSVATADARLARRLELRSPVPAARLKALRRLIEGGVRAGILLAPILPGITDDREGLSRLMAQAKEAGARYVVGSALRLGPAARHRFLPVLAREFPHLAERYERHFARRNGVSAAYQRALNRRLDHLKREHGFPMHVYLGRHRREGDEALVDEQRVLL
jgi:DNA repair photolyase